MLGSSDEVVVFLHGRPVYSGNNALYFREPKFLRLLDVESEAVYLPLKKGDNELVLSVTEYFGGGGFEAGLRPPGSKESGPSENTRGGGSSRRFSTRPPRSSQRLRRIAAEIAAAASPTGNVVAKVVAALVHGL